MMEAGIGTLNLERSQQRQVDLKYYPYPGTFGHQAAYASRIKLCKVIYLRR